MEKNEETNMVKTRKLSFHSIQMYNSSLLNRPLEKVGAA